MQERYPLSKRNTIVLAAFHVAASVALFFPTWHGFWLAAGTWYIFGCLGITMTFHRYLTHGGFKTSKTVEWILALIGCLPLQGDPLKWVADHWKHHQFAEVPGVDPHTPKDGKWWSHMDWILHPDPKLKEEAELKRYAPSLYRRPFYQALRRFFWVPTTVWGFGCLYFGGIYAVGWGLAIPVVFGLHATWLVNSATHIWGYRRFNTNDNSRNTWWVAVLTFGEGWHNNHHGDSIRARHGIVWYEFDPTWLTIKLLAFLGVIWDVKDRPKQAA